MNSVLVAEVQVHKITRYEVVSFGPYRLRCNVRQPVTDSPCDVRGLVLLEWIKYLKQLSVGLSKSIWGADVSCRLWRRWYQAVRTAAAQQL